MPLSSASPCYYCCDELTLAPGMVVPACEFHRWMPLSYVQPELYPGYFVSWKRGIWA